MIKTKAWITPQNMLVWNIYSFLSLLLWAGRKTCLNNHCKLLSGLFSQTIQNQSLYQSLFHNSWRILWRCCQYIRSCVHGKLLRQNTELNFDNVHSYQIEARQEASSEDNVDKELLVCHHFWWCCVVDDLEKEFWYFL